MSAAIAVPVPAVRLQPVAVPPPAPEPMYGGSAALRKITVDEYHRMIETGILSVGEPVELLEGYLVQKMSRGSPHDGALDVLEGFLNEILSAEWFARGQKAVTVTGSEPEPDIAVVRGPRTAYRTRHPVPADVGLLIEASSSSILIDRRDKSRVYAQAGIPAYWVVNVVDGVIEVFTHPSGPTEAPAYATRTEYRPGDTVPVVLDGVEVGRIAVADVIG